MRTGLQPTIGTIHTVAGTGEGGLAGDGGPAVAACLHEPKGVALDPRGNLLIADSENHAIRLVERTSGLISTIAGLAPTTQAEVECRNTSDQVEHDDPLGDLAGPPHHAFAQQTDLSGTVRYVLKGAGSPKRFGGDGGSAAQAVLNFPTAVVADAQGHLYIADQMNHRIRRVDGQTGIMTTVAGVGHPRFGGDGGPAVAAALNEPAALAISHDGRFLYLADQSNNRVRAIDLRSGLIRTVAGTGTAAYNGDGIPATEAALAGPSGLAVGHDGTLYIADTFNGRIRAVDPMTGHIMTVVGDGGEYRYQRAEEPPSASIARPSGMAVDMEGNVYLTDSDNHLVRRWHRATGRLDRLAGVGTAAYGGDGGSALEASLSYPFGIALDRDGQLFIADTFNHRIRKILV
jgi:DNA-binding beta-propeller fold protein YncE